MDPSKVIGPVHDDASQSSGLATGTLPADLLREQATRVAVLYAVAVVWWGLTLFMDVHVSPHGDRGPYRLVIEGLAALLAAATAGFARFTRASDRSKVRAGLILFVPQAFAIALLNSWVAQPTTMRPLSGIAMAVLFFGMMAPARPVHLFIAAIAAASMDPLGVWIAHLRGLPVPSPAHTFAMYYSNYVCAVLAVAPARILFRLARQVREARALGSYQLLERLGEGGMGEVWSARHRLLARTAAIKLIRTDMLRSGSGDEAATVSRFEREAQATAALTSPHTVRLFDFGVTDQGTFYYVMELLDGRDLESLVREFGPLPPARALYIARQVCESLAEAHAVGLVHRDIKPANIYVCRMGLEYDFVKVLDFGLVKREECTPGHDARGGLPRAGTPAYMSPEAIRGEEVDRRADVYAVGCVLYFLLTGEPVFAAGSSATMLQRHLFDTPAAPSTRTEQPVSSRVDQLVLACLAKDPNRRPQRAEDIHLQIREASVSDGWDQRLAGQWWDAHLPDLSRPAAVTLAAVDVSDCAAVA